MRVGSDFDGCIYNFGDSVHRTLIWKGMGHLWKSGPTPKPFWNWFEDWKNEDGTPWTSKQFVDLCNEGADAGIIFCGEPRPNAVEAMWRIKSLGHKLIGITDRSFGRSPEVSKNNTFRFLTENPFPKFDEVHFTADKTSVPVDVMVEDKWENFVALESAGIETYLITRPWNEDFGPHERRINDISDYADIIEEKSLCLT